MDEEFGLLALALAAAQLVFVAVVVLGGPKWRQRKARAMAKWAHRNGWHYEHVRPDMAAWFLGYPFDGGRWRSAKHVLTRTHRGRQVLAFQHSYTSGDPKNQRTVHHEVVAIPLPAPLPMLEVTRQRAGHRILGLSNVRDLRLPNERFNSVFRVRTDNEQFAHDVLSHDVMEWLLADGRARNTNIRFDRTYLVTWRRGPFATAALLAYVDFVLDFLERVPPHVSGPAE